MTQGKRSTGKNAAKGPEQNNAAGTNELLDAAKKMSDANTGTGPQKEEVKPEEDKTKEVPGPGAGEASQNLQEGGEQHGNKEVPLSEEESKDFEALVAKINEKGLTIPPQVEGNTQRQYFDAILKFWEESLQEGGNPDEALKEELKIRSGARVARLLEAGFALNEIGNYSFVSKKDVSDQVFVTPLDIENLNEEEWIEKLEYSIKEKEAIIAYDLEVEEDEKNNAGGKQPGEDAVQYPVYANDDPTKAKETHERRVKKYGEEYVVTDNGRGMQCVWSKTAWEKMDGKTDWKIAAQMPKEVIEMHLNKANQ